MVTPLGSGVTLFSDVLDEQMSMQEQPYAPFKDCKEWGLVKWLMQQTNQSGADEYLKLEIVSITHYMLERSYILPSQQTCEVTKLSFKNKNAMLKKVDLLPMGPLWNCNIIKVTGDQQGPKGEPLTEEMDIWQCNTIKYITDLMGNPAFKNFLIYKPVQAKQEGQWYYSEMSMGDWWWNIQVHMLPPNFNAQQ